MKKIASITLMLIMLAAAMLSPAHASPAQEANPSSSGTPLTLTYTPSSAYASSIYYRRATSTVLTGDQRTDIINVALSQVGYHEGDRKSELDGSNKSGTKNYSEYGYWFGIHVRGDSTGFFYDWCAMFIAWCARQARIPVSVIHNAAYARAGSNAFYFDVDYHARGTYTPKPGDLIFYDWHFTSRNWDHVGIVCSVSNGIVTAVEGNASEQVLLRRVSLDNTEIQGYGVPAYRSSGSGSGGSSGSYPVPTRTLKLGCKGDDVKWLQSALKKLGYSQSITGNFMEVTKKNVIAFQKSKGLTQDGIVGPATREKLKSAISGSGSGGSSGSYPVPTRTLKLGCTGDDVKWLQSALKKLGYSQSITGNFKEVTKKNVIAFQKSKGLTQDGIVGPATRDKLKSAISASGSGGSGSSSSIPYPVPTRTLTVGCSGDDVKWLQAALKKLGYSLTIDGKFGSGTESKVKAFQKSAGLTQDGKVGPATRSAIQKKLG